MYNLLTIVIPIKNEEKYIGRLLQELYYQNIGSTQIIISDANSSDKSLEIIECFRQLYDLNIIVIKGGLPSVGRNRGSTMVKTPYILFIDGDITFTKNNAIFDAILLIGDKELLSSTPVYFGETDIFASVMFFMNKYTTALLSKFHPFAVGGFTMVKTESFNRVGGYNENVIQSEDWLFSKQFKPKEFKLIHGLFTQDNRRFKKFGYLNMIKMMVNNFINRNNLNHFKKDNGYWD
jgi:glycosyltransferase involved in cell wall biosynthesis